MSNADLWNAGLTMDEYLARNKPNRGDAAMPLRKQKVYPHPAPRLAVEDDSMLAAMVDDLVNIAPSTEPLQFRRLLTVALSRAYFLGREETKRRVLP